MAAAHEELARGSALLVALSTPMDNNEGWLAAGLGLQRLLLVATDEGYATSYLNQPIELSDLRTELAKELSMAIRNSCSGWVVANLYRTLLDGRYQTY